VSASALGNSNNGYVPAAGLPPAREAVASYYSTAAVPLKADDVVMASGCSGALELVITAMLNEGENLLVPNPGFPLYEVVAKSHGAEVKKCVPPNHNRSERRQQQPKRAPTTTTDASTNNRRSIGPASLQLELDGFSGWRGGNPQPPYSGEVDHELGRTFPHMCSAANVFNHTT
jgi:hypothetical protein